MGSKSLDRSLGFGCHHKPESQPRVKEHFKHLTPPRGNPYKNPPPSPRRGDPGGWVGKNQKQVGVTKILSQNGIIDLVGPPNTFQNTWGPFPTNLLPCELRKGYGGHTHGGFGNTHFSRLAIRAKYLEGLL